MDYEYRRSLYRQIEEARGNPLIVFVTSMRQNASGQIAPDVIPELIHQINDISEGHEEVDLLVVSNGGDPLVAWRIVNLLRERFRRYNILLPYAAYSAATLLALGADKIVMHPFANLGPVDPQITSTRQSEGKTKKVNQFGSEDLVHYLAFVRENVGITNQQELERAFELLCQDVGALEIGAAKRSSQLMLSLGEKLLGLHTIDKNEARTITESLNKSFYHHGYSVGRTEARDLKLKVADNNPKLEKLIWEVWQSVSQDMKCDEPFDPLEIAFSNPESALSLSSGYSVNIPMNLPPPIAQQAYNQVLQQIGIQPIRPVEFEVFFAMIESVRSRSIFKQKGEVRAVRLPDMNINLNITPKSQKWVYQGSALKQEE